MGSVAGGGTGVETRRKRFERKAPYGLGLAQESLVIDRVFI
jgi:hypothetical protein